MPPKGTKKNKDENEVKEAKETKKPKIEKKESKKEVKEKEVKKEVKEKEEKVIPTRPVTPRPATPKIQRKTEPPTSTIKEEEKEVDASLLIEEELKRLGYVPINRIMETDETNDNTNEKNARIGCIGCVYVKAINPSGYIVFVEMDEDGYIIHQEGAMITTRKKKDDMVSLYSKKSAMECAQTDVCGLAFECRDGICSLTHSDSSTMPEEVNFVIKDSRKIEKKENPVAYPIVRMSEIRHNPELTLKNVDLCTKRLRNTSYRYSNEQVERTFSLETPLREQMSLFKKQYDQIYHNIRTRIDQLEKIHNIHLNNKFPTEASKKDFRTIQHNLKTSNDMVVDLLQFSSSFSSKQTQLQSLIDEFKQINQSMNERFPN